MNTNIDYHCHYTGSLSLEYIYNCLKKRNIIWEEKNDCLSALFRSKKDFEETKNQDVNVFRGKVLNKFSSKNWKENYDLFFKIYSLFQSITKSPRLTEQALLYETGGFDICQSYIHENVKQFQLRVGPRLSLEETILRINSLIKGFDKAEKLYNRNLSTAKLVLTLIQNADGSFINTNHSTLSSIFHLLEKDKIWQSRIIGFDFSGPEKNRNFKLTEEYLKEINSFKRYFLKKTNLKLETMVHIGEFVEEDTGKILEKIRQIDKLLSFEVERISHGTVSWIDSEALIGVNKRVIAKKQKELLKKMAKLKTHLEICPTANKLLSPMSKISKLPFEKLDDLGINFSVNTDNKSIFSTNLSKEKSLFRQKV